MNNFDFFKANAPAVFRRRLAILKERNNTVEPDTIEEYTRWLIADADTGLKFPKKNIYVQHSDGRFCILKDFYPDSNSSTARISQVVLQFPRCATNNVVYANDVKVADLPMDIYALVRAKVLEDMKTSEKDA